MNHNARSLFFVLSTLVSSGTTGYRLLQAQIRLDTCTVDVQRGRRTMGKDKRKKYPRDQGSSGKPGISAGAQTQRQGHRVRAEKKEKREHSNEPVCYSYFLSKRKSQSDQVISRRRRNDARAAGFIRLACVSVRSVCSGPVPLAGSFVHSSAEKKN